MIKGLLGLFTGGSLYGYLALALVAGGIGAWGAGTWVHRGDAVAISERDTEIARIKEQHAEASTAATQAALGELQQFIAGMHSAETDFAAYNNQVSAKFAAIERDIKNAPPIPTDCVIDPVRLRALRDATAAANNLASAPATP